MKFKDLLQGKTQQAQHALDDFFANIKEERILWYPSAGCDYRDVMEMRPERLALHQIPEAANIICHTDYMYRWTKLDQQTRWITVHKHARTLIRVIAKYPLAFTSNDIRHQIRREHTVKFNHKLSPMIFLLKLKIKSDSLGTFYAHVFYFIFGNYNFLEEVILKKKLAISHFVKVRQGCGFGGCRKCISVFYGLLGTLRVKYLLVDSEVHYRLETHHQIALDHHIQHQDYRLQAIGVPLDWSGYRVRAYRVETLPGLLSNEQFNENLSILYRGWTNESWKPLSFFPIDAALLERDHHHHDHRF